MVGRLLGRSATPRLAHHPRTRPARHRRDAFALLEGMREDNGSLLRHIEMGYATARRPDGTPP